MTSVADAVVPAAGSGSRLGRLAVPAPKALIPLWDRPAIDHCIDELASAGIGHVTVVEDESRSISRYFDRVGHDDRVRVDFAVQEQPTGSGAAVLAAREFFDSRRFVVALPDLVPLPASGGLSELLNVANELGASVLALKDITSAEVRRCGVAVGDDLGKSLVRIESVVEKPQLLPPRGFGIIGRYILSATFVACLEALAADPCREPGELGVTDGLVGAIGDGLLGVRSMDRWLDIGTVDGYQTAWRTMDALHAMP